MKSKAEEVGLGSDFHRKTFELFSFWKNNIPALQNTIPTFEIFLNKDILPEQNKGSYQELLETCTMNINHLRVGSFPAEEWPSNVNTNPEIYAALLEYWQELIIFLSENNNGPEERRGYPPGCMQSYNEVIDKYLEGRLPAPIKELIAIPVKIAEMYEWTLSKYFSPWYELSGEMRKKYSRALCGDREAYKSFLRLWYRALHMNGSGLNNRLSCPAMFDRQRFDKLFKSINAYIKFVAAVNKITVILYGTVYETMEGLINELLSVAEEGKVPYNFADFYRAWWKANEQAFHIYFHSKEYTSLIKESTTLWYSLKNRYEELMSDIFEEIPSYPESSYSNITG